MNDKPNEFEHGLMLGYLLIKGKQTSEYPKDGTDERTTSDGVLKTWVEKTYDKYSDYYGRYEEEYGIFQTLTHSDGTVEEWSIDDFTSTYPYGGKSRITKGKWLGWELAEPVNGIISNWYYYLYNTTTNKIEKRLSTYDLHWGITV